eukprot:4400892-Pyramimonas_sp.AAC.1
MALRIRFRDVSAGDDLDLCVLSVCCCLRVAFVCEGRKRTAASVMPERSFIDMRAYANAGELA